MNVNLCQISMKYQPKHGDYACFLLDFGQKGLKSTGNGGSRAGGAPPAGRGAQRGWCWRRAARTTLSGYKLAPGKGREPPMRERAGAELTTQCVSGEWTRVGTRSLRTSPISGSLPDAAGWLLMVPSRCSWRCLRRTAVRWATWPFSIAQLYK